MQSLFTGGFKSDDETDSKTEQERWLKELTDGTGDAAEFIDWVKV